MVMKDLRNVRIDYNLDSLTETDVRKNPQEQLINWMDTAIDKKIPEPTAFCLSTIKHDLTVSSRIVLAKEIEETGLIFYTNYNSAKGLDIAKNGSGSAVFFWAELQRQVRIEGELEKIPCIQSDSYYSMRPLDSKIGAWASPQSEIIGDRTVLENNFKKYKEKFSKNDPGRPSFWGGIKLSFKTIEFWQGRQNRLHDRIKYRKKNDGWEIIRLAP